MLFLLSYLQDRLRTDDRGATAVEYGLLVAGIAAAIVAAVFLLGPAINAMFQQVLDQITP